MRITIVLLLLTLLLTVFIMPAVQSAPSTTKHVASSAHSQKTTPATTHKGSTAKTSKPPTGRSTSTKPKTTKRGETTAKLRSPAGRKKRLSQWDWA